MEQISQVARRLAVAVVVSPCFVRFLAPHISPRQNLSILSAIVPHACMPLATRPGVDRNDDACDTLAPTCDKSTRLQTRRSRNLCRIRRELLY